MQPQTTLTLTVVWHTCKHLDLKITNPTIMKRLFFYLLIFLSLNSYSQLNNIIWDSIIFDSSSPHIKIDDSQLNIWQIGNPQKTYLDSAYSNSLCLVTDTIDDYPVNNISFFDLYIGSYNHFGYPGNTFIEFKHKYDSDSNKDGVFITISMDNGTSWITVLDLFDSIWAQPRYGADLVPYYENLYSRNDTLFNGTPGFSGQSDGWITTLFSWYTVFASTKSTNYEFSDTMIVRFNFISDGIDNQKDGWLIDDIRFYSIHLPGGAIKEIDNSTLAKIYPNPTTDYLKIDFTKPYNNIQIDILSLQGDILFSKNFNNREVIEISNLGLEIGYYILYCILDNETTLRHKLLINN